MSEERRRETVKLVHTMTEESKQKVRDSRQDEMRRIETKKKEGVISEDEMFSEKKMVEEKVKKTNEELANLAASKEEEIMRI
jgi:ribosome recycling factor